MLATNGQVKYFGTVQLLLLSDIINLVPYNVNFYEQLSAETAVNAADNKMRDPQGMDCIKIDIDP